MTGHKPAYAPVGTFERHLKPDPDPRSDVKRALIPLIVHTVILPTAEKPIIVTYIIVPVDERASSQNIRAFLARQYPDERLTLIGRMARYIEAQKPGAVVDAQPIGWGGWKMITAEWKA